MSLALRTGIGSYHSFTPRICIGEFRAEYLHHVKKHPVKRKYRAFGQENNVHNSGKKSCIKCNKVTKITI